MYLPALPAIGRDFQASPSEVQLTLSTFFLGLALGQLILGPFSDAFGRRRPLLIGLSVYALASLLCALAPSIGALAGLRFVQGFAGAAGVVVSRAVVRDLHTGVAAARFLSMLMLISGLAPILAPVLGGQLLEFMPWNGIFFLLAGFGVTMLLVTAFGLRETLLPGERQSEGLSGTLANFRHLLTDRTFMGYALAVGLSLGAIFCYLGGSPFVLQEVYGVSPQTFSLIFGMNALGLVTAGQVNGRLVGRVEPLRLLATGLTVSTLAGLTLLVTVTSGVLGLAGVLAPLFVILACLGFIMPNATVLALSGAPRTAGAASALLGLMQFALGAIAAPLVGLGGDPSAFQMALVMASFLVASFACFLVLSGGARILLGAPASTTPEPATR